MKKIVKYILLLISVVSLTYSCVEDKGNYDYDWQTKVSIEDISELGYSVTRGSKLTITPTCFKKVGTKNEEITGDFNYLWVTSTIITGSSEVSVKDTIATTKVLDMEILIPTGKYMLELLVVDNSNGLVWRKSTQLEVTLTAKQGWVFLEEDPQGYADINLRALVTFDPATTKSTYKEYPKLLSSSGIDKELLKNPRQICTFDNYYISPGGGVWFVTEKVTGFLDVKKGHSWEEGQVLSNYIMEPLDKNYTVKKLFAVPLYYSALLTESNNFRFSPTSNLLFSDNLCYMQEETFELAPFIATRSMISLENILCFDQTKKRFLTLRVNSYTWSRLTDTPTGYDLVYMDAVGVGSNEKAYCLLKKENEYSQIVLDPPTGKVLSPLEKITATENLLNATQYAYHQSNAQLYYARGNKLFVSKKGVEYETDVVFDGEITVLLTKRYQNLHLDANANLVHYREYVIVATKNAAGKGKVQFFIPASGFSEKLVLDETFEFENKIVSIDYQCS